MTTYEDTEHLLSIVASLLTSLASESPSRIRLLAKFVESDYEKIDRLLELREDVETRVHATSAEEEPEEDLDEDDLYLAKLDKGLFSLQLVDYIIAWLCMEDDGVRLPFLCRRVLIVLTLDYVLPFRCEITSRCF